MDAYCKTDYAFVSGALVSVASVQTRQYYFVSTPLNWTEAQSFCRRVYADLATAESKADVSAVISTTTNYTGKFFILESYTQHIHTQDSGFLLVFTLLENEQRKRHNERVFEQARRG